MLDCTWSYKLNQLKHVLPADAFDRKEMRFRFTYVLDKQQSSKLTGESSRTSETKSHLTSSQLCDLPISTFPNASTEMTATSTTPDFLPTTAYNDPPEDVFDSIKGKQRATTLNDLEDEEGVADGMQGSAQQNRNMLNGRKPPKQPRSRRMNNASPSSTKHVRACSRASSNTEDTEINDVGIADTLGNSKNRYPAHSSIPTASNGRPPPSLGHISERFDREIHALEHEIEDTLFRGSEADKRKHGLTREESRESQTKYHPEDQSMDMDVSIDEETLRRLRRARYLRSAAVTGIFVLLWWVPCSPP